METFAEAVTQFCLRKHLIDSHQTEWCHYMVVRRAMSIISLLWLVPVGALLSKWYISLAFVLSYRFLRSRTGGYHAKSPLGCILSSTCLQITGMCFVSCTKGLLRIAVLFVISSIIIIRQAPANNAELHLTTEEIHHGCFLHLHRQSMHISKKHRSLRIIGVFLDRDTRLPSSRYARL